MPSVAIHKHSQCCKLLKQGHCHLLLHPRSLPSKPIHVFARGDGSGTTTLVSSYLRKACPQQWPQGVANRLDWPEGINVVRARLALRAVLAATHCCQPGPVLPCLPPGMARLFAAAASGRRP